MPQQPAKDLPTLMDPNAGKSMQPTKAPDDMDEETIRQSWMGFFQTPEGEIAKLQFAASMLAGASSGRGTLSNISSALGDSVGAYAEAKQIGGAYDEEAKAKKEKKAVAAAKAAGGSSKSSDKTAKDFRDRMDYYAELFLNNNLDPDISPAMAQAWGRFMATAEQNDIDPATAERIWKLAEANGANPYAALQASAGESNGGN